MKKFQKQIFLCRITQNLLKYGPNKFFRFIWTHFYEQCLILHLRSSDGFRVSKQVVHITWIMNPSQTCQNLGKQRVVVDFSQNRVMHMHHLGAPNSSYFNFIGLTR